MQRVSVIGTSGSGKSTLAAQLAARLGVPHVELDGLHWQPHWINVSHEVLRASVAKVTASDGWVIDGNYARLRELIWSRADTVVWLNYPFPRVLWQTIRRSFRRLARHEVCCNGNYETLRLLFSRESIVVWALQTHGKWQREYPTILSTFRDQGGNVVMLRSPKETQQWLAAVDGED